MGLLFSECFLFIFDFGKVLILFVGGKKNNIFKLFSKTHKVLKLLLVFMEWKLHKLILKKWACTISGVHYFKVGFDQCWVGIANIFGYHPDITRASQSDLLRVSS